MRMRLDASQDEITRELNVAEVKGGVLDHLEDRLTDGDLVCRRLAFAPELLRWDEADVEARAVDGGERAVDLGEE